MSPIALIIILLVFNLIGQAISPPSNRQVYRGDYHRDFRPEYMHHDLEEARNRRAFSYTLVFVALLMIALFMAHELISSEIIFASNF